MFYYYGMRLRGFSIGCQPDKPVDHMVDGSGRYYDIIVYDRKLSKEETWHYDLDLIKESEEL